MFATGFADGLLIVLIMAVIGVILLLAGLLTFLLKLAGMRLKRAAMFGFGVSVFGVFLLVAGYGLSSPGEAPEEQAVPAQVWLPEVENPPARNGS